MGNSTAGATGWSRLRIKKSLREKGLTFRQIGRRLGYSDPRTAGDVMRRPWPLMEKIVADILGVAQAEIWPERYLPNGAPARKGVRGHYSKSGNSGKPTKSVLRHSSAG